MILLAIESSCDETSAAIMRDGRLQSLVVSSQADHKAWGGVVPELASRAHLKNIVPVLNATLAKAGVDYSQLQAVAVTTQPGLIGSLLVGLNLAKGIALARDIPLIAVNHIEAHLLSVLIEHPETAFPYLGLVVSGGHTLLYDVRAVGDYHLLGATRDDAAGEAFDKGARMLGLGYPGGPVIDKLAQDGNPEAHRFPKALLEDPSLDFSFSGLKTSLRYFLRDHHPDAPPLHQALADICASYQQAIVDALVIKTLRAAQRLGYTRVAAVGGVSANSRLRQCMETECTRRGISYLTTAPLYSTDNAAMIGVAGWQKFLAGDLSPLTVTAKASLLQARQAKGKRGGVAL